MNKTRMIFALSILAVLTIVSALMVMGDPLGAVLTPGTSSHGNNTNATQANAQAGNVTALNIDQTRITDIWQGFYGNVTGQIVLENSAGNNFYDWSSTIISGEVFATRNTISDWSSIACTSQTEIYNEENTLNIPNASSDGINDTFASTSHPSFDVGTQLGITGCRSTQPYNATGSSGLFWNVLLNSDASNVVYTVVLSDDASAFDGGTADFEILVPTDKSTGLATYYFYVELD